MSDRLRELHRQRRLVQEQLAWLDREISAASAPTALPPAPGPAVPGPAIAGPNPVGADAIIAQYQNESADLPGKMKRGCFAYFFFALALVGLGVFALYLSTSRK